MAKIISEWNAGQKKLNQFILKKEKFGETIARILTQHASVHTSSVSNFPEQTFEDMLWEKIGDEEFRRVTDKKKYSIAWHFWHCTRIEDIVVSFLIAHEPQIFESAGYRKSLKTRFIDTGNSMNSDEISDLSRALPIEILKSYRDSVGKKSREIINQLTPDILYKKVDLEDIERIRQSKVVTEEAGWLLEFWSKKKISGLVLMPLTRHILVHLNAIAHLIPKK